LDADNLDAGAAPQAAAVWAREVGDRELSPVALTA
jgi:hypothetical protein